MTTQQIEALKNELAAFEAKRAITKAMYTVRDDGHRAKRGYTYSRGNGI